MSVQVGKQPFQPNHSSGSGQSATSSTQASQEKFFQIADPSNSLPKGGGAIRGIGEKFTANQMTGTGSSPIAASPSGSGFGSRLSVFYNSGNGNGLFCFTRTLSLLQIIRSTKEGLYTSPEGAKVCTK